MIENLLAAAPAGTAASFYGTTGGAEMDLVLQLPGSVRPWAIEIKRGLAPRPSRGFRSAREDLQPERAFIVSGGEDAYPLEPGIDVVGVRQMAELLSNR